jgi:hypothetical protein
MDESIEFLQLPIIFKLGSTISNAMKAGKPNGKKYT